MKLDGKSIQAAMIQLVEDYKFDPYQILEISKLGIKSGFKKDYPEYKKSDVVVDIKDDGSVKIYKATEVVEVVEDEDTQIALKEAQKVRKDVQVGEKLLEDITPERMELSRIAAQSAAQTIKQSLKNIEREKFYEKFQDKEGELLKAKVIRVHGDSVILEIDQTTVVLPPEGQIPNRTYEPGEEIFVFLKRITKDAGSIVLDISQTNGDFIVAILEKIVPELADGTISVEKIARMAGRKTKVIVSSSNEKIDPVGVMVGHKGDRINTVLSLLDGEKIDFIEQDNNTVELIKKLLKPANVLSVEVNPDGKKAFIKVEEDQKPLAIGKGASNIRLASQLAGMNLEII
ncbi:MAG: transcription termination factor NusA [Candidatus Peribacteria bacterium]|jgi:N utilization substance protein A|nr:transcription termination factor NusA [Candidatus Peribacteria bacterium]